MTYIFVIGQSLNDDWTTMFVYVVVDWLTFVAVRSVHAQMCVDV